MNDFEERRSIFMQRNLIECKNTQLPQMKDNVNCIQAEKDLQKDHLWYKGRFEEVKTKLQRETQNLKEQNRNLSRI